MLSYDIENILKNNAKARNSDTELYLDYFDFIGLDLTPEQRAIFRAMPSLESIRRIRQKIQEQGKYPATERVRKERKFKSYRMQQVIPGATVPTVEKLLDDTSYIQVKRMT